MKVDLDIMTKSELKRYIALLKSEISKLDKNIPVCPDCEGQLIYRQPDRRFMEDNNYVECPNGHVFELVPPPPVEGLTAKELIKQIGDPKRVDPIQLTIARLFLEGRLYAEDHDPDTKTTTFTKVTELKEE